MKKRENKDLIRSLEIALDMLDRSEGTALYEVQKRVWGWSDKRYNQAIDDLALIMMTLQKTEDANDEA